MKENEKGTNSYLYAKDAETLQISYAQYMTLKEKVEEARNIQKVKESVLSDLRKFLATGSDANPVESPPSSPAPSPAPKPHKSPAPPVVEKVSPPPPVVKEKAAPVKKAEPPVERTDMPQVPPIKKEIAQHFNKFDESGRLFNVFKQYYTCLNDACGGTMRVTMKDGICSLWNYDEWEEFAFVDIFENHLRIAIDPIYTDEVKSLSLCEVPRLLSSRRNLICVQVDDLNNLALEVLTKAFKEAGMQVK